MITSCVIKDNMDRILATGILLERDEANCSVQLKKYDRKARLDVPRKSVTVALANHSTGIFLYSAWTKSLRDDVLVLSGLHPLENIQRRQNVKASMTAELMIHPVYRRMRDGHEVYVCNVGAFFHITLKDISAGGLGFYCKDVLDQNQLYFLMFPYTKEAVELLFTIVRYETRPDGRCCYGCKFQDIPREYEELLRSFVYYHELENTLYQTGNRQGDPEK